MSSRTLVQKFLLIVPWGHDQHIKFERVRWCSSFSNIGIQLMSVTVVRCSWTETKTSQGMKLHYYFLTTFNILSSLDSILSPFSCYILYKCLLFSSSPWYSLRLLYPLRFYVSCLFFKWLYYIGSTIAAASIATLRSPPTIHRVSQTFYLFLIKKQTLINI